MRHLVYVLSLAVLLAFQQGTLAQNSAVTKADQYLKDGKVDKAKEQIDLAVVHEKTKEKGKTWFTKGMVYEEIAYSEDETVRALSDDAFEQSLSAYNKVKEIEKEGSVYDVYTDQRLENMWAKSLNKGATYFEQKDFDHAYIYFEESQRVKPTDTTAFLYAGIVAQQNKKYDLALKNFYQLVNELEHHDMNIYQSILFIERSKMKDLDKALAIVSKAREHYPTNADLMKEEINLLINTKKVDMAKTKLENAIETTPDDATLYYSLAYLHEELDDKEQALKYYNKAIELKPDYFEALYNVAVTYYNIAADYIKTANNMDLPTYKKEGKALEDKANVEFKKALPYFEKAHKAQPNDQQVIQTLQVVYKSLSMNDKANEMNAKLAEE